MRPRGKGGPALRRALLGWYRRSRRNLPWRQGADAYRVWVSEVMLQQTTVKAVVPYYERFLQRFPDLRSLAAAEEDAVVAAWSGLGYYRRARNLHRGAQHVAERHGGSFPRSQDEALHIPGVGRYTAAAVLSIAYGEPHAVVDGNVRRVLARLFALRGPQARDEDGFYELAQSLLDPRAASDWNQAVMELGATLCTPRAPLCPTCPLREHCRALAAGLVDEIPEPRARRAPEDVVVAAALVERSGRVLLARRPEGTLMSGMWEVPQTTLTSSGLRDLTRELRERYRLHVRPGPLVATARHAITFRRIRLEGYRAELKRPAPEDDARFRWVAPDELVALPVSSMTRKLMRYSSFPSKE